MKIVNLETFLKLPKGTVFSKFNPMCFEGLKIKGDSLESMDFTYQDLIGNVETESSDQFIDFCILAQKSEKSLSLDFYCPERDGQMENEQLFAVYELDDLAGLINRLLCSFYDLTTRKP